MRPAADRETRRLRRRHGVLGGAVLLLACVALPAVPVLAAGDDRPADEWGTEPGPSTPVVVDRLRLTLPGRWRLEQMSGEGTPFLLAAPEGVSAALFLSPGVDLQGSSLTEILARRIDSHGAGRTLLQADPPSPALLRTRSGVKCAYQARVTRGPAGDVWLNAYYAFDVGLQAQFIVVQAGSADSYKKILALALSAIEDVVVERTPAPGARPAAAPELPEIFVNGFYRAPGGIAIVSLPELEAGKWTIEGPKSEAGVRKLAGFLGTRASFRAFFSLAFLRERDKTAAPDELLRGLVAELTNASPFLSVTVREEPFEAPGGKAVRAILAGKSPAGVDEVAVQAVIADGPVAAALLTRGNAQDMNGIMKRFTRDLIASLRVGARVPRLPRHDPGTPLEGVWKGPFVPDLQTGGTDYWYVFDPRGYLHDRCPSDDLDLDLEARFQQGKRAIARYTVRGGRLETYWLLAGSKNSAPIERRGEELEIDGDLYRRVDGKSDGMKLAGHWRSSSYIAAPAGAWEQFSVSTSRDYYFTADGRFSTKSFTGVSGRERDTPEWRGGMVVGAEGSKPTSGHYVIRGDRLFLTFGNGTTLTCAFFLIEPRLVYIGGDAYLLEE